MNDDIKQIILGSLLGNGYICHGRKNDYFCMKHSMKNLQWLRTKAAELKELASQKPFYEYENSMTWRSSCNTFFTELRNKYYKDNEKCVTMEWLDQLRDLGIAVWFADCGSMVGRGNRNACLRTQIFKEGNKTIEQYFNEVGMPCSLNKSRKSYIVVFTHEGTEKILSMIANCLPKDIFFDLFSGKK